MPPAVCRVTGESKKEESKAGKSKSKKRKRRSKKGGRKGGGAASDVDCVDLVSSDEDELAAAGRAAALREFDGI